jgi:hypothetical protein
LLPEYLIYTFIQPQALRAGLKDELKANLASSSIDEAQKE